MRNFLLIAIKKTYNDRSVISHQSSVISHQSSQQLYMDIYSNGKMVFLVMVTLITTLILGILHSPVNTLWMKR